MNHRLIRMYLVNARQKLGYSQYRVSKNAGLSHQHYNRIENGVVGTNIQFRTIEKLANALAISTSKAWEEECNYQALLGGQNNAKK